MTLATYTDDIHPDGIHIQPLSQDVVSSLYQLRQEIEREAGGLTRDQAFLLIDVCGVLRLSEAETLLVVGNAYSVMDAPCWWLTTVT